MPASRRRLATLARPFLAGLIHSVLMVCAFPPVGWWPLALVAIVPLVWTVVAGWHGQAALGLPVAHCAGAFRTEFAPAKVSP